MKNNMKTKKITIIVLLVIAAISLIITIIQVAINISKDKFMKASNDTIGTVESITSYNTIKPRRGNHGKIYFLNKTYVAYVTYEVNGVTYEHVKIKGTYDMEEGSLVEVFYLPEKPEEGKSRAALRKEYAIFIYFLPVLCGLIAYGVHKGEFKVRNESNRYL